MIMYEFLGYSIYNINKFRVFTLNGLNIYQESKCKFFIFSKQNQQSRVLNLG